jgi:peptidoglycan/LPS O-acetylase OafA/YrhL
MTAAGSQRFVALDSWRGLAALGVALFHLPFAGLIAGNDLARHGFLFVDFFFVLSGFVILHGHGDSVTGAQTARLFLVRRFARLYPLHVVTLGALLAIQIVLVGVLASGLAGRTGPDVTAPFSGLFAPEGLGWHLVLATPVGVGGPLGWNVMAWSVAAEMWAYGLFAVIVVLSVGRPTLRTAGFALAALAGAVALFAHPAGHIDLTHDLGFARCVYGFCLGALARMQFETLPPVKPGQTLGGTLLELAVLAGAVGFILVAGRTPVSLLAPFVFVVAVLVFARQQGALSVLLAGALPQALGRWSYSIYLWQFPLAYALSLALGFVAARAGLSWRSPDPGQPGATLIDFGAGWINELASLGFLAALVVLAALSYVWIEQPARRWLARLLGADVSGAADAPR